MSLRETKGLNVVSQPYGVPLNQIKFTAMKTKNWTVTNYEFTVEQGIAVQREHLAEWKTILKSKAYKALEQYATKDNDKAMNGYDICRGTSLDNFMANYAAKLNNPNTNKLYI